MQEQHPQDNNFNKIRAFFWPIYGHELKKIIPMFAMFFLISFVYHLLRCLKIAVVIKAPGSGAEIIPFLKVWFVLPAAFIFSFAYARLAARYDRVTVFKRCLSVFIIFFITFTCFLFPYREQLEINFLENILPPGLHGLSLSVRYWPLALVYVFAEMWSIMVLTVLFWGFSNEITKVNEAKRFYAFIALGANCAAIFSGETVRLMSLTKTYSWIPYGTTAAEQTVFLFMFTATVLSLAIVWLYSWINKQSYAQSTTPTKASIHHDNTASTLHNNEAMHNSTPKPRNALSWREKLHFLVKTPELGYLTLIVLAYNVISNLADIIWNYQLDLRFADSVQLVDNLGKLDMMIGFTTVVFALFGFSNVIRKFGWRVAAITTPIIFAITTSLVFTTLAFEKDDLLNGLLLLLNMPIHEFVINIFMLQMCLGKASKYTFFDQSKEIAFIPLNPSQQRTGKAIIDGITSRFGKSGSSIYVQALLLIFSGEIVKIIPYTGIMMFIMFIVWFYATNKLSKVLSKKILNETVTAATAENNKEHHSENITNANAWKSRIVPNEQPVPSK